MKRKTLTESLVVAIQSNNKFENSNAKKYSKSEMQTLITSFRSTFGSRMIGFSEETNSVRVTLSNVDLIDLQNGYEAVNKSDATKMSIVFSNLGLKSQECKLYEIDDTFNTVLHLLKSNPGIAYNVK